MTVETFNPKTLKLKSLQDQTHSMMIDFCNEFKSEEASKIILLNLTTVSKEINSLILQSIVGKSEILKEDGKDDK